MKYKVTNVSGCQRRLRKGGMMIYLNQKESVTLDDRPLIDDENIFKIEEVKKNGSASVHT